MTKQEAAIKYITENYLDYNRLRHDIISDKLQVRWDLEEARGEEHPKTPRAFSGTPQRLEAKGREYWKELSKHDINSIVCHAAQEYDQNITSREVLTALQSDLIPQVHPLREYVLSCGEWTEEQPDWIDWVASQVRVKNNDNINNLRGNQLPAALKENIPCCSRDIDSSGCVLVVGDNKNDNTDNLRPNQYSLGAHGENNHSRGRSILISLRSNDRLCRTIASGTLSPLSSNNNSPLSSNNNSPLSSQNNPADALWRICFKKWFVAMVASWMNDEVVNHQVLVLIGKQGIYKTTWLEHLIPPQLRDYCCKLANATQLSKDDRLRIAEFGLINLDELDAMTPRELNAMKSIITATDVNERAAYGYTKERRIRLASFCASSNRRDFLTDITGNRRWLPFEVESIQNPFFTTLPYERMYAQAWALANDPTFCYWFELDEIEVLEEHNKHFRDESNEEQLLAVYFAVPAEGAEHTKFLTTAEISEKLISAGNIKRPMSLSRLGMLLGQQGFIASRHGTPPRRGWIVYERGSEEINAERRIFAK